VIEKYVEAIGGRAAIGAIESIHMKGTLSVPANGMGGSMEMWAAKPNKNLVKQTIAGIGDSTEGFDGTVAWMNSPMSGPMLLTGDQLKQRTADSDFSALLNPSSRYSAMKTVEKTTFDGRPCYKVSLMTKHGSEDIDFYDVETGLKAGAVVTRQAQMGMGPMAVTQVVLDYKKFDGLLVPTTLKQTAMGVEQILKLTTVEFDKVPASMFEPPAQIKALLK
jgi:hypothetical protein